MCGFVGILDFSKRINFTNATRANKVISHRGPDHQGDWSDNKHIYLGHNRLSVIDISYSANQPFQSEYNDSVIVFNGEIYNYKRLREELSFNSFITNSDTEVILYGYLEQGVEFFKKLRGIYAFAILDRRYNDKIILARDPSGVKPLYYREFHNSLTFSSEIKGIIATDNTNHPINNISIRQFLNLGYIPEPNTVYKNIYALRPGYYMEWSPDKDSTIKPFFQYSYEDWNSNTTIFNTQEISIKLKNAVRRNLVADVNISLALSGGIDSSIIYHLASQLNPNINAKTVSFSDDPKFNEADISKIYASRVAGNHEIINIKERLDLNLIDELFLHFDQPYADSSAIPTYLICKSVSKDSKVIIGGDGGDELFNGYPSQTWLNMIYPFSNKSLVSDFLSRIKYFFSDSNIRKTNRLINLMNYNYNPINFIYDWNSWLPQKSSISGISAFIDPQYSDHIDYYSELFSDEMPNSFKGKIIFDYFRKKLLSDYLRKTDMMSMLNGIEWRVPFLDEDLSKLAFSIPFDQKSNIFNGKIHLRSLHKKIYPQNTSFLPKKGFQIPLDTYISNKNKRLIAAEITKPNSYLAEYINIDYINYLTNQFINYDDPKHISRESIYQRILMFFVLQRWYDAK